MSTPSPDEVGIVTRDESGNWYVDGEQMICSLGGHEGKANIRSIAKKYTAASPEERARMEREWAAD